MNMAKKRLYIAYGSNLNLSQMAQRCPTAQLVGPSVMKDWRLRFRGSRENAVATVERFHSGRVPVLIWQLTPQDEKALDRYEGWPQLYRKEIVRVKLNGRIVNAMIFIMNEVHPYSQPSPYYLSTICEGYLSAGFDIDILRKALRDSLTASDGR